MNKFVTCKIQIAPQQTAEMYNDMGIEDPTTCYVDLHFKPEEVIAYREDPPLEGEGVDGTVFSLPNEEYYTEMPVSEFEKLINANR